MKRYLWPAILCCVLSVATVAFSQTSTTSLRGVVKDSSGALVPGAAISLANQATGNAYHAVTNSAGYYIFPIVVPERYRITVAFSGFATQTVTAELLVGQPATINFILTVKSESVTVDVSAEAETLNLTDATIGNAVGNATIETLPMEGRDPVNLLSLHRQHGPLGFGDEVHVDPPVHATADQGHRVAGVYGGDRQGVGQDHQFRRLHAQGLAKPGGYGFNQRAFSPVLEQEKPGGQAKLRDVVLIANGQRVGRGGGGRCCLRHGDGAKLARESQPTRQGSWHDLSPFAG